MPITLTTVIGNAVIPDGTWPRLGRLEFVLTGWAKDDDTIYLPGQVDAPFDESGNFSIGLQTSDDLPVNYDVSAVYWVLTTGRESRHRLGRISVPASETPVLLADLLSVPAPDPTVPDALAQALAAAAAAAGSAAATAADRVQTGLDRGAAAASAAAAAASAAAAALYAQAYYDDPPAFLSSPTVWASGTRINARTGEVWEIVSSGEDFTHPVSGIKVKAIPSKEQEVTLTQVGGDHTANGRVAATARTDSSNLLTSLLSDSDVKEIVIPEGAWRFDNPVDITTLDRDVTIRGAGIGRTAIEIYQTSGYGISIAAALADLYKYQVTIEDMSVYRVGAGSYVGSTRPQTVRLEGLRDPVMNRVDTYGGIGFGLLMTRCLRPTIQHCLSHDSAIFNTGTDAIHFSRCRSPRALFNKAWNVGDDLLSFGSYNIGGAASEVATTDVLAEGNSCWGGSIDGGGTGHSSNSGVKLYGNVKGARIINQYSEECNAGGIYFADHNSIQDGLIEDVQVIGGQMVNCRGGGGESAGALRWRFNSKDNAGATSIARRITFSGVQAIGCRSFFYSNNFPTVYGDHYLEDWSFENCKHLYAQTAPDASSTSFGIKLTGMYGRLNISDMEFADTHGQAVFLESTNGQWGNLERAYLHRIKVRGYNSQNTPSVAAHAIWVRASGLPVDIRDVDIQGQKVANGTSAASRLNVSNCRPDSVISGITGRGPGTNSISGSYRTNDARTGTAVPSTGTWEVGDFVGNTASSGAAGWRCRLAGTFGTLGTVNATGTSGDFFMTVDALGTLQVGEFITAASGLSATGTRVVKIEGLTVHLHTALSASISGVAVSYYAPTFKTEANYV